MVRTAPSDGLYYLAGVSLVDSPPARPPRLSKSPAALFPIRMPNYFKSMRFWWLDLIACYVAACAVTPADPLSAVMAFVPIAIVWMTIRYVLARRSQAGE